MKYGSGDERPGRGDRPALDRSLVVVGHAEVQVRRRRVAVLLRDVRGGDEPGDLGGDRRRRIAALLLPALGAKGRSVADEEVRGRADVGRVAMAAGRRHRHARRVGHQERVGRLVELGAERIGRQLAVDQAVAGHRPVGELLPLEEELERVAGGVQVAIGDQARPRLVEVAREHLAVRPEVGVGRVTRRDRLAPRRGEAGDDRAGERLVLRGLDHVRGGVVLVDEPLRSRSEQALELLGRIVEVRVVLRPAGRVGLARLVEPAVDRALGRLDGLALGGPEAEGERECRLRRMAEPDGGRLDDVARAGGRVGLGQRVGRVELDEAVARAADEPTLDGAERPVEGGVHRLGVVAVRGLGGGARIGRHGDRMAGRGVDGCRIGTAVAAAPAAVAVHAGIEPDVHVERAADERRQQRVHQEGVARRVGDVVRLEPVLPVLRRARNAAGHAGLVERTDRGGRVATLEVGEGRTVRHDVLERLDVRGVDRRVVDVREDAVGDREPDLRAAVPRRPDAILAGEVEVGKGAGPIRSRSGSACHAGRTDTRCEREHEGHDRCEGKRPSRATTRGLSVSHRRPPPC